MKLAALLFAMVLASSAAEIDGRWTAETARANKAVAAGQNNNFTLDFRTSQDGKVTGTVSIQGKKKPRSQSIQNATLNGNQLTFTTVQNGKKATVKFSWQVTVDGGQLTGTRTREGAKRGVAFKARKLG